MKLDQDVNMASLGVLDASKIIPEFMGTIEFYAETLKGSTETDK